MTVLGLYCDCAVAVVVVCGAVATALMEAREAKRPQTRGPKMAGSMMGRG